MRDRVGILVRYARVHHSFGLLAGLLVVAAGQALIGPWTVSVPAANDKGVVTVPFWHELPIVAASMIAGSLHSEMNDLEGAASRTLRRLELSHLITAVAVGIALLGVTEAATADTA